jgi:hypothetical protein
MPLYNAGNAYLQVVPSFKGVEALMKRELNKLGDQVDDALEKGVGEGITAGAKAGGKAAKESLAKDAESAGGAFAAKFERRVTETLKALGSEVEIEPKTKAFDTAYNRIIGQLRELSEMEIGPDFTAAEAAGELADLGRQMRELENEAPDLNKKFNLRQARAEAGSFLADLRANGASTGADFGQRLVGAFATEMRKGIGEVLATLPEFPVGVDTTEAQRKVNSLRASLAQLDADIEVGLDDAEAEARLRDIMRELEQLDQYEADPSIAINSAIALSKLAAIKKLMDGMDGQEVDVTVDVDRGGSASSSLRAIADESGVTLSRLGALVSLGGAFGTAIVPAAAAAAVAVAGIGFAALGAVAGVGTLFLAFDGIGDAAKALHQYNQDADKSAKSIAQSQNQIASAIDSVKSAEDSLANARESAADRQRSANDRILKAIRAIKDADREYTAAIKDQKEAREALNAAYREAARDLADLNSQVKRNSLDQRQAVLDEKEAREELEKIMANPRATAEEREQARINYEQRVLQIEDLKRRGEELAEKQADANKKGIEGSEAVTRAQADLQKASEAVERAAVGQKDAQEQLARAQADAAREQRTSQRQIAAAVRSLDAANRQLAQSYTNAGTAGGDALDTLNDKMAELSPAGQKFVYFLDDVMRPAMDRLQKAAQEGLFPGLTEGLTELVKPERLEAVATFVEDVGDALGDSFAYAVEQLNDPVWQEFFGYIGQTASPVIRGAAEVALNFAKGIANIMNALTGFNGDMGRGLIEFSEGFVRWSQRLTESQGFQEFIDYVRQEGPHVVGLLKQFAIFFGRVVVAAAPIGAVVVRVFEAFLELLNKIPIETLTIILGALAGLSIALLVLAAGTAIATASVGTLIAVGLTALGAALAWLYQKFEGFRKVVDWTLRAVGAVFMWLLNNVWIPFYTALWKGLVWLYKNIYVPYFTGLINRTIAFGQEMKKLWPIVQPVFQAIGDAAMWLWEKAIKPALGAIGGAFRWLWENAIKPALDYWASDTEEIAQQQSGIWSTVAEYLRRFVFGLQEMWNNVLRPTLSFLGDALMFLWRNVVVPVFDGIVAVLEVAWEVLKFIFGLIVGAVRGVAAVFEFLWGVATAMWDYIVIAVDSGWAVLQVIFGLIQVALKALGMAFRFLYELFVKPWIDLAVKAVNFFYQLAIKPTIDLAKKAMTGLADWWNRVYREDIKPFWDNMVNAIKDAYDDYVKPYVDAIKNIWNDSIVPAWRKGIEAAAKLWDGLKELPKKVVRFIVTDVMNDGLLAGYNKVAKFFKVKPDDVRIDLPKGFATGGQITGPGTGTSDSVLIRASAGEHMWTAREVRAAGGHDAVYALRRAVVGGWLPGYAKGGAIGRGAGDGLGDWLKSTAKKIGKKATDVFDSATDFLADPVQSMKDLVKGLLDKVPGKDSDMVRTLVGMPGRVLDLVIDKVKNLFMAGGGQDGSTNGAVAGNSNALGGSAGMIAILRQVFPGLSLNSGFRPGSITVTGNRSYHGMNRAIDVPPRRDVFEWIRSNYPNSRELIFSPMGSRQIHNGRPHVYSGAVRQTHYDHVHWAYDQGGYLRPGYSMVYNGTGSPEPVLTAQQWRDINAMVQRQGNAGNTYQFAFRDTTLDPGRLRAIQDREAVLSRAGRAR